MAIDFTPTTPKSSSGKIDFVPHETVGGHLRDMGKNLINEIKNPKATLAAIGKEGSGVDKFNKGVENVLQTGGAAFGNSLINLMNMIGGRGNGNLGAPNIPNIQGGNPNSGTGVLGGAIGEALGYVGSGGVANAGGRASARVLEHIPQITEAAANALSKIPGAKKIANAVSSATGKATAGGATFGAAQEPDNRVRGAITGGLAGGVPTAAFQGLARYGGMAKDVIPGLIKEFAGSASPAEAKLAASLAGNAPVGLGHILDSPSLQALEKGANKIPLSGGVGRAEKVQQAADNQSEKLLNLMRGGQDEESMARALQKSIAEKDKFHRTEATTRYDDFLNTAKESGVKVSDTPQTQSIAQKLLKEHTDTQTPLDEKVIKKLEQLSNPEFVPDVVKGQVTKTKEVDEIHNQIKALKKAGRNTTDPYLSGIYNDLSGAMRKDLHGAALDSKNPDITSKLSSADKYYKENRVPYKQKDIQNIIGGKANLENIQNTLTQEKDHINKVVGDLPDNLKKSTAYLKFKSAIKEQPNQKTTSEPQKLFNAFNKLSKPQKDKLFTDNEQTEFHRLGLLAKASKNKGHSSKLIQGAELGGPLFELLAHGNLEGALAGLGVGGAVGLGARGIGKALTSPGFRNSVVNAASPGTDSGVNALMPLMQAGSMGSQAPQQPETIDFQIPPANSLNQIDNDLINNQIMSGQ